MSHWTDATSHYCSCDGHKAAVQDHLQDRVGAEDLRAMTLLNSRAHSCSITVNLQSIAWPTTHEWNLAAFADASILEKKKIGAGDRFFFPLVLVLLNYINNFLTTVPARGNTARQGVSSDCLRTWRPARRAIICSLLSFQSLLQDFLHIFVAVTACCVSWQSRSVAEV